MTREEFLVRLGIDTTTPELEAQIDRLLERIRREMNENVPSLNIEIGNTNEVLTQLSELHASIAGFENEQGAIERVQVTFDNTNGTIIRLNSNLQETVRVLSDIERQQIRNLSVEERRSLIDSGRAYGQISVRNPDTGEVERQFGRLTDRRMIGSITGITEDMSTINYIENSNSLLQEHSRIINEIIALTKKMDTANRAGNTRYAQDLENQIDLLNQRAEQIRQTSDLQSRIDMNEMLTRSSNAQSDREQKAYENILKYTKQIEDLRTKIVGESRLEEASIRLQIRELERKLGIERDIVDEISRQRTVLNNATNQGLEDNITDVSRTGDTKRSLETIKNAVSEVQSLYNELLQTQKKLFSSEEGSAKSEYYQTRISEIEDAITARRQEISQVDQLNLSERDLLEITTEYNRNMAELSAKRDTSNDTKMINDAIKAYQELKKAQVDLERSKTSGKASVETLKLQEQQVEDLTKEVERLTKATLSNGEAVKDNARYTEKKTKADKEAEITISKLNDGLYKNKSSLDTVAGSFGRVVENVIKYNLAQFGLVENMQRAIQTAKELDDALTNIRLVTGESAETARQTMNSYADLAKELGTTTQAVAEGNIEWLRQGYTAEDANELIRASTMLSTLGMMDSAEASEKLTATLNGYKMSAEDAMSTVDKLVNVDLMAATSAEEVATSLQYVASQADLAGVSIDKLIGLIATTSETTRLSAESIGNAWKSILSRMQNVKLGKFIDDDGEAIEILVA